MSTQTLEAVPAFETINDFDHAIALKGQGADADLYPRDGSRSLYAAEQQIAAITGNNPEHIVLQNTGMSALKQAIDVALEHAGTTKPTIAYAGEMYAKSGILVARYAKRHGLNIVDFDSGSNKDIDYVFDKEKPDIIFTETVANGPTVPVLDHNYLLERVRAEEKSPVVILDHTLPLTSGYDVFSDVQEDDKVLVVESGTKAYTRNAEIDGITFVKNEQLRKALLSLRCDEGGLPGVASTEYINTLLPESREVFDARNRAVYEKTAELAFTLYAAQHEAGADFVVSHPSLGSHANFDYASTFNDGRISPIFYVRSKTVDQHQFAQRIEQLPGIIDHTKFGQSFGFDEARILKEIRGPFLRISAGAKTDTRALGALLTEAFLTK